MKKQYQRNPLPDHHRKMEVRGSAAEAAEAAKTTATANPAKTGETQPPNQPPDDNAPVTRGEFREETYKLDRKIDATKAELKEDIHKLDKKMGVGFAETKAELKDEIHKSGRTTLWTVVSIFGSLVVAVVVAMFGMLYYVLSTVGAT